MMRLLRDFGALLLGAAGFVAAMVAAVLPRRYWTDLEEWIPVSRAALASALATLLVAAAIGIPGFLDYAAARAAQVTEITMQSSGWRPVPGGGPIPTEQAASSSWLLSFFSLFEFAFLTPLGLFTTYLAGSSIVRAVALAADDGRGDPVLGVLDAVVRRVQDRVAAGRARTERERLEGDEVPDRVVTGKTAGLPAAELVVVASRRKADWTAGTFVITSEKWYRLGEPVERMTPGGLRTLYPLTELRDHEAMRKAVRYELPTSR